MLRQSVRLWLKPDEVEAIVFWTRHVRPLMPYLAEIDQMGHRYTFQYTITNYPRVLENHTPLLSDAIHAFCDLAQQIGPERVIWRYDPILLSPLTPPEFHRHNFRQIARALQGYTRRCVISLYDSYAKTRSRMKKALLCDISQDDPANAQQIEPLLSELAAVAAGYGMQMTSCAEERDLSSCGILPGKCIDDDLLRQVFGLSIPYLKDPGQRKACACLPSKDIGVYDTCVFGCQYCYATTSFERARRNFQTARCRCPLHCSLSFVPKM